MEYRILGRSVLKVSAIGLGCMSLKSSQEREAIALIHRAMEMGVNLIDTADLYERGLNEELVGKALLGKRDQVILATKVGNQARADGSGSDWNPRKAYIIAAIEESLRRLQTDRIDLYQLHGGTIGDPMDETIDAFETLESQGKILHYGISSIRPNVIRAYVKRSRITSVMLQYSLADRRPEESLLELLNGAGIGVLVRGALAQGLLVNKPGREYLGHTAHALDQAREKLSDFTAPDRTKAQVAIRYILQQPAVSSVVVGARSLEQLEEAVSAAASPALTPEALQAIRGILPPNRYEQHRHSAENRGPV
jgi:aryl-alcohol dehydrogenase-like predicted oxidoreductase